MGKPAFSQEQFCIPFYDIPHVPSTAHQDAKEESELEKSPARRVTRRRRTSMRKRMTSIRRRRTSMRRSRTSMRRRRTSMRRRLSPTIRRLRMEAAMPLELTSLSVTSPDGRQVLKHCGEFAGSADSADRCWGNTQVLAEYVYMCVFSTSIYIYGIYTYLDTHIYTHM